MCSWDLWLVQHGAEFQDFQVAWSGAEPKLNLHHWAYSTTKCYCRILSNLWYCQIHQTHCSFVL